MSFDDREFLQMAFRNAMENPHKIVDFSMGFRKIKSGDIVTITSFRYGYAYFVIAGLEDFFLVCDISLDTALAVAAE